MWRYFLNSPVIQVVVPPEVDFRALHVTCIPRGLTFLNDLKAIKKMYFNSGVPSLHLIFLIISLLLYLLLSHCIPLLFFPTPSVPFFLPLLSLPLPTCHSMYYRFALRFSYLLISISLLSSPIVLHIYFHVGTPF